MIEIIENKTFDMERALYNSDGLLLKNCRFDGPADGESALKESRNVELENCFFNLRYPFWHDDSVKITDAEMTEMCRAAIWYSRNMEIAHSKLHGIKALRECANIKMRGCDVISPEFGWSVHGMEMLDTTVQGEYFMMRSDDLYFDNVTLKGKYSFQYIEDAMFEKCRFDTKDAFWHAKNVTVKDSVIKGEYLAWYSDGLTLINCKITGTQPFCYCRNLKLVDCEMTDTDLAFEKSEVEAVILTPVISIKNPLSGTIHVPDVGNIILDDKDAKGEIKIDETIKKEHQITACA